MILRRFWKCPSSDRTLSVFILTAAEERLKSVCIEEQLKQTWKGRELISNLLTDGNAPNYSNLITPVIQSA
jgi:hypothetical protein